ncbi:MAG: hypothetical protein ACPGOV_06590 [Magnetovibrionaceae bacterium]
MKLVHQTALPLALIATLAACNMNKAQNPMDGLEFREARYQEMMRLNAFEACREQGLELDRQARARGSAGAFLASAEVLAGCSGELSAAAPQGEEAEVMRTEALAITNYIRGGDVARARALFDGFRESYPDHDLYFADGSSFIATTEALLGRSEPRSFGSFAALNVNKVIKHEMRRLHRWQGR